MFEKIKNFIGRQQRESKITTTTTYNMNTYNTLGKFNLGAGSIQLHNRDDVDKKILSEMYQRVTSGEFNISVTGSVPEICVDGRTNKSGKRKKAPSAAGGSLSIVYGSDLGSGSNSNHMDELQLTVKTIETLTKKGHATSVHGDNHSSCGCGACAKAKNIYQHIIDNIDKLCTLTSHYGIVVEDTEKEIIIQQAKFRLSQPHFFAEDRASVLHAAREHGAIYEELVDEHNELGIALNTKHGTTVDRAAIRAKFGSQYDLFIVDVWAFGKAAEEISQTDSTQETACVLKAITLQNVATASVLGHSSLPILPIS